MKKIVVLVIALLLITTSIFAQKKKENTAVKTKKVKVRYDKSRVIEALYYVQKSDKTIKEGNYKAFHPNKAVKEEGVYRNNKREGAWKSYNEKGDLLSEGDYVNGRYEGKWVFYHQNGVKSQEGTYQKGLKWGHWLYYNRSGDLVRRGPYKRDLKEGIWRFFLNNQLDKEVNYKAGKEIKASKKIGQQLEEKSLDKTSIDEDDMFMVVEVMPEFLGGNEALMKFVYTNIKYPKAAKDKGIEGTVYLSMVIGKKGEVEDVKIKRGLPNGGEGCDEEALRVVRIMPNWTPGMQRGEPVRVKYTIPIKFKLN